MHIGRAFTARPRARAFAIAVGCATVGVDFVLIDRGYGGSTAPRLALAGGAAIALLLLARGDRHSLGLTFVPVQGWRAWIRITGRIALVLAALIGVATLVLWATGRLGPPPVLSPAQYGPRLGWACGTVPWFEEGIYRLALCVPLVTRRQWPVIVVSGVVFALLHVAYGNAAPDNIVAGYVLAWAFLRSGSILVPIALHALGNAVALSVQLAAWYLV